MNAAEIRALLANRAEEVCRLLLPSGKRVQNEWHAGDVRGGPGDSLKVKLAGPYAGSWKDWANDDDKGSLLDLWMKTKGIKFGEAMAEAAKFLGVSTEAGEKRFYRETMPKKEVGAPKVDFIPVKENGKVWNYLVNERKLKPEILRQFGIGQTFNDEAIVFPYRTEKGERVQMVKYIALQRDEKGHKKVWSSAGTKAALFGKETVGEDKTELVICEGEIDAMTVAQCGVAAVSVPYGAKWENKDGSNPNDVWIEGDYDFLERFQNIYLCFDADESGRKAAASLAKRLGVERCLLVRLPEAAKDPNELLKRDELGILGKAISEAKSLDPEHLKGPEDFVEQVYERFFPKTGKEPGLPFMFPIPFRVRSRELTVWTGYSGHGKSMLLSHEIVDLMAKGERVCVASMEMEASKTLQNMWRQAAGLRKPEEEGVVAGSAFRSRYDWFVNKVWIYDRMGDVSFVELLSVMSYAARRYRVSQFVIDSLCKLNVATDDYDGQRKILNDLCAFAVKYEAHVHLVAHSKKPQHGSEERVPGKYEVSGSAAITDLAFNGITVWRNKSKEERLKPDSPDFEEDPIERQRISKLPDAFFMMWKQRNGEDEPVKNLWYNRDSCQYHDEYQVASKSYIN